MAMQFKNRFSSSCNIDVVGIGNAIVDVLQQIEDNFLNHQGLNKGSMSLINEQQAESLYKSNSKGLKTSGGSVANTIVGISQLGGRTSFIGRVRDDKLGKIFSDDIREAGVIFDTPPATTGATTARCLIYVTPDAERTMCTFLGASTQLQSEDLDLDAIKKAKVLYLEGYLWDNTPAKMAFITAADICRENGGKVALSLSDNFCVDRHRESFLDLVDNHVDLLFANEKEIKSLYKTDDIEIAIEKVCKSCSTVAITCGSEGSVVISNQERWDLGIFQLGNLVDTTGAGDLYAAGFLYAYTQGESLERCGQLGALCAGQIVTHLGARSQISLKELVISNLS